MFNSFIVSCIALVPGIDIGWIALVLGSVGTLIGCHLALFLARAHWHETSRHAPWRHLLHVAGPSLGATALYMFEGVLGLRLLLQPADTGAIRSLAFIIISLYAVALVRAWTLLGDPQYGWSGWLNPFQDLVAAGVTAEPPQALVKHRSKRHGTTRPTAPANPPPSRAPTARRREGVAASSLVSASNASRSIPRPFSPAGEQHDPPMVCFDGGDHPRLVAGLQEFRDQRLRRADGRLTRSWRRSRAPGYGKRVAAQYAPPHTP
jgi:hypothetical protein